MNLKRNSLNTSKSPLSRFNINNIHSINQYINEQQRRTMYQDEGTTVPNNHNFTNKFQDQLIASFNRTKSSILNQSKINNNTFYNSHVADKNLLNLKRMKSENDNIVRDYQQEIQKLRRQVSQQSTIIKLQEEVISKLIDKASSENEQRQIESNKQKQELAGIIKAFEKIGDCKQILQSISRDLHLEPLNFQQR